MKYTVQDLQSDFPDDAACMRQLIELLYPHGITCRRCAAVTKHYPVTDRKEYACGKCGRHMSPLGGTIFCSLPNATDAVVPRHLPDEHNKAGTSAKQIERETGVTYKTAWRMMHQIRKMMDAPDGLMEGEVEVDETYVHPNTFKRSSARRVYGYDARRKGEIIFGIVQRGGGVKVWHVRSAGVRVLRPIIAGHVKYGATVHTDGAIAYRTLPKIGCEHRWTEHGIGEYYREDSYTQNIENFWSHFKRGIRGIYRHVGKKYLQAYANEYAWRYSNRKRTNMFWALTCRIDKL